MTKCEFNHESNHIQMANGIRATNSCLDCDTEFEQNETWDKNAKHIHARIQFAFIILATVVCISESFSYFSFSSYRFPHLRNVSFFMYIFFIHSFSFDSRNWMAIANQIPDTFLIFLLVVQFYFGISFRSHTLFSARWWQSYSSISCFFFFFFK